MIRSALILALLLPLGTAYHPQYIHVGPVFPTGPLLNPCLISAWPMNEGSGLTLHDTSTGGTNTATINTGASVTWQSNAGLPGTTPKWNGSGYGLATSTTLTNFDGTTPFSVAVWVNITSIVQNSFAGTLNASAGTFKGWELQSAPDGRVYFFLVNNFPSNSIEVFGNALPTGTLHYVVATYDGSRTAAGVKLYIDGGLGILTTVNNSLSLSTANGLPARFGARNDGTAELTGAMAFAEVYNCALTSTQIATYAAAGPGIY